MNVKKVWAESVISYDVKSHSQLSWAWKKIESMGPGVISDNPDQFGQSVYKTKHLDHSYQLLPWMLKKFEQNQWLGNLPARGSTWTIATKKTNHSITKKSPCNILQYFKAVIKVIFGWKNVKYLLFLLKTDRGYTLEPPHWGRSNEYPRSMFWIKNKKKCIPL